MGIYDRAARVINEKRWDRHATLVATTENGAADLMKKEIT